MGKINPRLVRDGLRDCLDEPDTTLLNISARPPTNKAKVLETQEAFLGLWWDSPMENPDRDPRESQKMPPGRD